MGSIRFKSIARTIGVLLCIISLMMMLCVPFSLSSAPMVSRSMFFSAMITLAFGLLLFLLNNVKQAKVFKREGYLIVTLSWVFVSLFGALPYMLSIVDLDFTNAVFESVSGFTTTGASIFNDIESLPRTILIWRSLTQWLGGMGIVVLTVALLPLLGIGGIELFTAEAPGPTSDKIHPKIKDTARILWLLYVALTAILGVLLYFEGMTPFDALNHALTTMATGGFSTKNASIAYFQNPTIEYTLTFFMFLAGNNFIVTYYLLQRNWSKVKSNDEFRVYLMVLLGVTLFVFLNILHRGNYTNVEESFRHAVFQVVTVITTTGFSTHDYTTWTSGLTFLFFMLLFMGACAGSTSGGIKIIRHMVFFKNTYLEFNRILHPRAMIRLKLNGELVQPRVLTHILVFLLIYIFLFAAGTFIATIDGLDLLSAVGGAATSIGNVGPGIGELAPSNNFLPVPDMTKWTFCFLMLCGRLELFSVLVLFTVYFWRN